MAFEFKPNVGDKVPNEACSKGSDRFQNGNKLFDIKWAYFGKDALLKLLGDNPDEMVGIKVIPGIDGDYKPQIFLSSVTKSGETIVSFDLSDTCPPICPPPPPPNGEG